MSARFVRYRVVLLMIVGIGGGGVVMAQTGDPVWADDLYTELTDRVASYNANVTEAEFGVIERWVFQNARINLHVTAADGTTAIYAFRTDDALFYLKLTAVSDALTGGIRQANPEMDAVWRYGVAQTVSVDVSKSCQTAR